MTFDRQEDAEKAAVRAKEIQAEVNSEEGTKVEFKLYNHEDGHTLSIDTLSKYVDKIEVLSTVKTLADNGVNLYLQKEQLSLLDDKGKTSLFSL